MKSSGIPLVFIHAFPLSERMWDVNRAALGKNFRFISVDLPGFGRTPLASNTSTMESMADHVLKTLDAQGITEKFVVAGLSMGGYVMLQVLKKAPGRVRAAAFLSTRAGADSPEACDKRFKNIEFIEKNGAGPFAERMVQTLLGKTTQTTKPELVEQVKDWVASADPKAICAALRGMAERPDMTATLDSLQVPTLFLAGEEDVVIAPSEMEANAKRVAKSEFHTLPAAGHLINLENHDLFNDLFLKFLKRRVL